MDAGRPEAARRRARQILAEAATSVGLALAMVWFGTRIAVDPTDRIGQVSAMAQLQLALAVAALLGLTALTVLELRARRRAGRADRSLIEAIGCAAVAGVATGLVAGGVAVALRDTPYGLWADQGDYAWILQWVDKIINNQPVPHYYPPMFLDALAGWSWLTGTPPVYAIKEFQLVGTALFGPVTYLVWRLVLRPAWALGLGLVAAFPFIEPVKPYTQVVLVLLIPVLIALLRRVRRSATLTPARAALAGAGYGIGFGLLFLLYSGWFVWAAPGAAAALAIVLPWRRPGRALLLLGTALVAFVAVTWVHLTGILGASGGTSDNYFYFDTNTDPAFFAMWRNDVPGDINPRLWPPPAEWSGVGLFSIILVAGVGVALWLGWRRTPVIAVGLVAVSAWVLRMYLAGQAYATHTVRLYPRTTMVLLYTTLVLAGFAVHFAVGRVRSMAAAGAGRWLGPGLGRWSVTRVPVGLALIPLVLLLALGGSNWVDRLMPGPPGSFGGYARIAQNTTELNGACPRHATSCTPRSR